MGQKTRRWMLTRAPVALAAAGLGACAPAGDPAAPRFPFAAAYRAAPQGLSGQPVLLDNTAWWRRFGDPVLDSLVDMALRDSLTIAEARARMEAAQAGARALAGPFALTSALSRRRTVEGASETVTTAEAGLDWLLDPWGGRRAERRAAAARAAAAEAETAAARLLVLSALGQAYLDLRLGQRLLVLAEQEAAGRARTLAMTRELVDAAAATQLDITRSEARVADIRADLPGLRAVIAGRQNEIAVLAGVAPGALPPDLAAALQRGHGQPRPGLAPDPGIPADLLRNRPDIRVAEQGYFAALAEVDQARAALYPRLTLSGSISLPRSGGETDRRTTFGPSLDLPPLPGNASRAGLAASEARVRAAHAVWQKTVLDALLAVENALLDYQAASRAEIAAAEAARLHRTALELTRELFAAAEMTLGELIDAEQAVSEADERLASLRHQRAVAFVALNVALGVGHAGGPAG